LHLFASGVAFSKAMIVMQLLLPMRRACAGDRINVSQMERAMQSEEQRLRDLGFSTEDIKAGKQLLMAAMPAFNAVMLHFNVVAPSIL
jgi:hypothetical protein